MDLLVKNANLKAERDRLKGEVEEIRNEIRETWPAARDAGGQLEAFHILERMVDRLGYGRVENNPSIVL
jgi:hypothetical protein